MRSTSREYRRPLFCFRKSFAVKGLGEFDVFFWLAGGAVVLWCCETATRCGFFFRRLERDWGLLGIIFCMMSDLALIGGLCHPKEW